MPTILELRDQSNKLLHDAQQIMLGATVTAEQRTQVDAMIVDADIAEADAARLERSSRATADQRSSHSIPRSQPGAGADVSTEVRAANERRALDVFVRGDINGLSNETRASFQGVEHRDILQSGTGGTFVPQAFIPTLTQAEAAWGDLLTIVNSIESDTGAPAKYALSNDTSNIMYEEGENIVDPNGTKDPTLTGALITTSQLSTPAVLVSWAEMTDSSWSIETFVRDILGKRYFRSLSAMCVNGSTSGNIASLLGGIVAGATKTTAVTATISYPDIAALYGLLDPAYEANSTFAMNSTTRAMLLGVVNTLGDPVFVTSPSSGAFSTLLGRPVKIVQALPNIATGNVPIVYGDFKSGYTLKTVKPGLSIVKLTERYADKFCTGFIPYVRAGAAVTDAGTHPLLGLKVK
jgi:HK97 family phage major capsid protein